MLLNKRLNKIEVSERQNTWLRRIPFWISFLAVVAIFYDFGFDQNAEQQFTLNSIYTFTLFTGVLTTVIRYLTTNNRPRFKVFLFDLISVILFVILIIDELKLMNKVALFEFFDSSKWYFSAVFLVFIRAFSDLRINLNRTYLNPAQVFIISFLAIIGLGTLLLSLPNATYEKITFIDALFTSTSAVCVTGLIVVDTGSYFTLFGQCIILVLIQIGGLGIMTFASYFSYFFRGVTSYENQLVLSDMTSSNKIGEVFTTLKKIILITIIIEFIGAVMIFGGIDAQVIPSFFDRSFFAIFHSVSAFCNAGFSTLDQSLFDINFRFNYGLQGIILLLFVIGGLGFPIVFNLFKYLTYIIKKRLLPLLFLKEKETSVTPWIVSLNSRITLITTFTLLIVGTLIFLFFEYNNSLQEHGLVGKVITALFSAAAPRTAGFSTVDISSLQFSTIMLIFLLMWVGASPGSTGGGIKTSTFAIATLNFWSLARGKNRIEVFRREIADISVRRAFAIISLSLVIIGFGVFLITYLDSEMDLLSIAFECFSAYSTVGLSVGITDQLSEGSKFVIIMIMFIGRVSMLTLLIALIRKEKYKNYRYSTEEILIN